jgi:hypothetical protein
MKIATPLMIAITSCGLLGAAKAEEITLSCVVSQQDGPRQDLFVKVSGGRVSYGSSISALVPAESMNKGSLSVSSGEISFRQTWPSTHVQWDWSIDRASGGISIKYINTQNNKAFLTKRGSCTGG